MQVPMVAPNSHGDDVNQPIRCAELCRPTSEQQHKQEVFRYAVVAVALAAVLLLLAIALYYTDGHSVHVQHFSRITPLGMCVRTPVAFLSVL